VQAADGRNVDLSRLCGKAPSNPTMNLSPDSDNQNLSPETANFIKQLHEVCNQPGKCQSEEELNNEIEKLCNSSTVCPAIDVSVVN
jgi:hypothetical protein